MSTYQKPPTATGRAAQPFYYEIRVRGHLSKEQWVDWVDDLTLERAKGETILRGVLPDHAALYALLSRLRDLAIPLLAVNVLDGESRRKLTLHSRLYAIAIQLAILIVYLLVLGGMVAFTVLLTIDGTLHTALAIAILFGAIGALAYGFSVWSGLKVWRLITFAMLPASLLTFMIYIIVTGIVHPALGIMLILLLIAAALAYSVLYLRGRAQWVRNALAGLRALGDDDVAVTSSERAAADSAEQR